MGVVCGRIWRRVCECVWVWLEGELVWRSDLVLYCSVRRRKRRGLLLRSLSLLGTPQVVSESAIPNPSQSKGRSRTQGATARRVEKVEQVEKRKVQRRRRRRRTRRRLPRTQPNPRGPPHHLKPSPRLASSPSSPSSQTAHELPAVLFSRSCLHPARAAGPSARHPFSLSISHSLPHKSKKKKTHITCRVLSHASRTDWVRSTMSHCEVSTASSFLSAGWK